MATDERAGEDGAPGLDPDESPFELPPIEGLPFSKDSEEARAIREVIEEAERERASAEKARYLTAPIVLRLIL